MRGTRTKAIKLARMVSNQNSMSSPAFKSDAEMPQTRKRVRE
jgi:hypothetical protein